MIRCLGGGEQLYMYVHTDLALSRTYQSSERSEAKSLAEIDISHLRRSRSDNTFDTM